MLPTTDEGVDYNYAGPAPDGRVELAARKEHDARDERRILR